MNNTLAYCESFTGEGLENWDVSNVTNMNQPFYWMPLFQWRRVRVGRVVVEIFTWMFADAQIFNRDLSSWDVSGATNTRDMFQRAMQFNSGHFWLGCIQCDQHGCHVQGCLLI